MFANAKVEVLAYVVSITFLYSRFFLPSLSVSVAWQQKGYHLRSERKRLLKKTTDGKKNTKVMAQAQPLVKLFRVMCWLG